MSRDNTYLKGNHHAVGNEPNSTSFKKGMTPWNKGISIRVSPRTEFKKGRVSETKAAIGEIRIRTDKNGKKRAWVKVAQPKEWKMRAVVEWEKKHGPLPKTLIVHHQDRNTLNDSIGNLSAISRGAHLMEHRPEFEEKRIAALKKR